MTKKTKRGGYMDFINKNGIYIADDIDYNIRQGKKDDLIKKYEDYLTEANENVKRAKEEKERRDKDEELENEKSRLNQVATELKRKAKEYHLKQYELIVRIIQSFFEFLFKYGFEIVKIVYDLIKQGRGLITSIGSGCLKLLDLGEGVIVKTIVLIVIIVLIFFGVSGFFNPNSNELNNAISTNRSTSSFIRTSASPSYFSFLSKNFENLIPTQFRISFNSFRNNFNKIVGNDLLEKVGKERQEISNGRIDGIYHIKKENENRVYTTLKPKDIEINLGNIKNFSNMDYHKLPQKVQELYTTDNNISIPVQVKGNTGLYFYNTDYIYNTGDEDKKKLKGNDDNYLPPVIQVENKNEFKLNKKKAIIFDDKDDKDVWKIYNKIFNINNSGNYIYPEKYINN